MCSIYFLFFSSHQPRNLNEYLNIKHAYIKFTNEKRGNGLIPFLDILVLPNNKSFTTIVYHKFTFS